MVASVAKNTQRIFNRISTFFLPFDNFLRWLACSTYIEVGKKFLSTTDIHCQNRKQTHTTNKIPSSLLLWLTLAFYVNLPLRLFLLGTYLYSIGKCQATARRAWQEDMCNQPAHPSARVHFFPLCLCNMVNGMVREWSLLHFFREPENGKRNLCPKSYKGSCYSQLLLHEPTLPLHQELSQRSL